jgi:fucose permease
VIPSVPASRAAISGFFFVNGIYFSSWVSRIPDVKGRAGLSEARLGLALLCMGLGTFLALPLVSLLIGRFGSRAVTTVSALGCAVLLALAGRATAFPVLAGTLMLFGAAMGSMDVAMNAQASILENQAGRSIMSSFHGLWSLGGLTGASMGGLFAARASTPVMHFLMVGAVMAAIAVAASAGLVRERGDAGHPALGWPSRPVLAIGVVAACAAIVEGGLADWSGLYLRETLGQSAGMATTGYAAFSLAMMIGRFAGDRMIDRFGARALLRGGSLLTGAAIALALLARDVLVTVPALALAGLGISAVFPIAFSAAGNLKATLPGPAIAAVATMAYGGSMMGPPFIGFAAEATSLPMALGLLVVTSATIALLAGRLTLRTSRAAASAARQPAEDVSQAG